ncbi:formate dehydrogenase [Salinisphaera sp. USBA-960]|uniref:NAD(P)H-dependent oxidoreductase subunit E n=1 Tax=Salinisphaera orenii TaxID=856731 RepID=UPI000DBE13AF|nr:formate dehydrogenase [Salifodinibacter halophilus]NNC25651.1 formate dehydrogenase [Salifodinibacter halophilus]
MQSSFDAQNAAVRAICADHADQPTPLLPILHAVQAHLGYVPDTSIGEIAYALNQTRAEIFGVLSFYHDFRREPPKLHTLKVCRAEACQAVGGRAVWSAAASAADNGGDVDVEAVYCLGNCACAPAVQLNGHTLGRVTPERVSNLVAGGNQAEVSS